VPNWNPATDASLRSSASAVVETYASTWRGVSYPTTPAAISSIQLDIPSGAHFIAGSRVDAYIE